MKRLLTLASTGLFATGLAILPVSVYAQPNAVTTPAPVVSPVVSHETKPTHPPVVSPAVSHDTKAMPAGKQALSKDAAKPATDTKDATKAATAKAGSAKVATTPAGATTGTPAKVGG